MNKSAIKTYAVWARTELIKHVTQRAYEYEVTADNTPAYNTDSVLLRMKRRNSLMSLLLKSISMDLNML